mmetsp:Transcript_9417/g.11534  ORF Transcript_9417/g.11534 Transcript_9417/m.11534 type:complete len:116 (-) Transcript_9417:137-484(-)
MFRRYLKKSALTGELYRGIHSKPYCDQGLLFAEALNIPSGVAASTRNQSALLVLISSHRILWRKQILAPVRELIGDDLAEIWQLFFNFFNETKRHQRLKFFADPVIRELWPRFIN